MPKHNHSHGNSGTQNSGGVEEVKGVSPDTSENQKEVHVEKPSEETQEVKTASMESELANSESKFAEMETRLAELNDQYLRKAADFENFRKRVNREKQELTEFANLNLLLDLLPVMDDFERAIKSAETSRDFASFHEGISMIEKRLSTQLENKWGLKRFDSEGQPFDPNRHEALQMEKSGEISEAVVKEDFVKGYLLKEKVIRYAKVKVLVPENSAHASDGGSAEKTGEEQGTASSV